MARNNFKLHVLILIVPLAAFFSASVGGYLYYSALKTEAVAMAHKEAEKSLEVLAENIESNISWFLKAANAMSELDPVGAFMAEPNPVNLVAVDKVLDAYNRNLAADVCYLMDPSGNTLATSNRHDSDSFMGRNYAFRPYFQQAVQGLPAVYMALGSVSQKRGVYLAHPIYGPAKQHPIGVAVIKASIETMEESFRKSWDGILLLADPNGVVFMSSRIEWLYHVLWQLAPEKIVPIVQSRQFGDGPFVWSGMRQIEPDKAVDRLGRTYRIHRHDIANHPGWQLIYLHDESVVSNKFIAPINKSVGSTGVLLTLVFGIIILLLYLETKQEITRRAQAEEKSAQLILDLQESLATVKQLSGLLPICANCKKIRDDKGYWNQIESYIETHTDSEFSHGICPDCAKALYPGMDIFPDKNENGSEGSPR